MLEDALKVLEGGTSLELLPVHVKTGATPLHVAAAKGYIKVMKYVVDFYYYYRYIKL